MIENEIDKVLTRLKALHPEDYIAIQKCWDEEIEILTRDMAETISFIENECDDDTFCWIGKVFEDVAERTQSKEFVDAIKNRAEKVVNDEDRRCVYVDVDYAEEKL